MDTSTNYTTLAIGAVAALNEAAAAFHLYTLATPQLDAVNKLVTLGFLLWAVYRNHHYKTPSL